jgi:hypothetical protein
MKQVLEMNGDDDSQQCRCPWYTCKKWGQGVSLSDSINAQPEEDPGLYPSTNKRDLSDKICELCHH